MARKWLSEEKIEKSGVPIYDFLRPHLWVTTAFYYQLKNMRILNSIFLPIIQSQKVEWRAISPNVLYVCFPILFLFLPPFNKEPKGVLLFIFTLITYHVLDRDKPQEIIILSNLHTTKVWKDDTLFVDGGFSHPIIFGHLSCDRMHQELESSWCMVFGWGLNLLADNFWI